MENHYRAPRIISSTQANQDGFWTAVRYVILLIIALPYLGMIGLAILLELYGALR